MSRHFSGPTSPDFHETVRRGNFYDQVRRKMEERLSANTGTTPKDNIFTCVMEVLGQEGSLWQGLQFEDPWVRAALTRDGRDCYESLFEAEDPPTVTEENSERRPLAQAYHDVAEKRGERFLINLIEGLLKALKNNPSLPLVEACRSAISFVRQKEEILAQHPQPEDAVASESEPGQADLPKLTDEALAKELTQPATAAAFAWFVPVLDYYYNWDSSAENAARRMKNFVQGVWYVADYTRCKAPSADTSGHSIANILQFNERQGTNPEHVALEWLKTCYAYEQKGRQSGLSPLRILFYSFQRALGFMEEDKRFDHCQDTTPPAKKRHVGEVHRPKQMVPFISPGLAKALSSDAVLKILDHFEPAAQKVEVPPCGHVLPAPDDYAADSKSLLLGIHWALKLPDDLFK
jgi:hypothetical protein